MNIIFRQEIVNSAFPNSEIQEKFGKQPFCKGLKFGNDTESQQLSNAYNIWLEKFNYT